MVNMTNFMLSVSCVHVYVLSCDQLFDPMDCSLPGPSVQRISQARILEWAALSFSRGYSQPRYQTCVSCISYTGRWIHLSTILKRNEDMR